MWFLYKEYVNNYTNTSLHLWFVSILFDILEIFNLSRQRYGRKHLAGCFRYWQYGCHVLLSNCRPTVAVGFCQGEGGFDRLLTCQDLTSLLCFLRSSGDAAAWCRRAGEPVCAPAVGVSDVIAGCHGDAGSQTQVLAGATSSGAHLVAFLSGVLEPWPLCLNSRRTRIKEGEVFPG